MSSQAVWIRSLTSLPLLTDFLKHSCDLSSVKGDPPLRWLEWTFFLGGGGYLPSLSINYVAMSKDMEKRFPQPYYIKMKIFCDLGFIAIGVAIAT